MANKLIIAVICTAALLFTSCNREKFAASQPAYLSVPTIQLNTTFSTQGSAHNKITTAWIFVNGEAAGTFELPCLIPVIANGNSKVEIYPGVSMNGINSTRAIYTPYEKIESQLNFTPLDTFYLNSDTSDFPVTRYAPGASISIVEDFDRSGLNLAASNTSDTNIYKVDAPEKVFTWPGEENGKAGEVLLAGDRNFFEIKSIEAYSLPSSGQSVWLEMSYRNNMPILVGIIAKTQLGDQQAQTLYIHKSEEWNKIYVNLVTEISNYPTASGYQVFIGGIKPDDLDTAKVFLDNIKLVY